MKEVLHVLARKNDEAISSGKLVNLFDRLLLTINGLTLLNLNPSKLTFMIRFNRAYFILTIVLFIIEFLIAIYAHDEIIRPFVGDLLVVILLYCLVKSVFNANTMGVAIGVLIFSYALETLQYFHIVELLGLSHLNWANILIGTSFEWMDLLMYTLGIIIILIIKFQWPRIKKTKFSPLKTHLKT